MPGVYTSQECYKHLTDATLMPGVYTSQESYKHLTDAILHKEQQTYNDNNGCR